MTDTTPPPLPGVWTLTAPDGRQWQAEPPLRCAAAEQRDRIPPAVAMDRVFAALEEEGANTPVTTVDLRTVCVVGRTADGQDFDLPIVGDGSKHGRHMVLVKLPAQHVVAPDPGGTHTCVGKGGTYTLIGTAVGAGGKRGSDNITVYRDTVTKQLYYRSEQDFDNRMALLAPDHAA